jgi:glutathione S-transferase
MLKIYGQARSRTYRVLWLCTESNIPFEHDPVTIHIPDATAKSDWYRALNPNARIPTIDDDGFVMWESAAINLYLAKKYKSPLWPDTPQGEGVRSDPAAAAHWFARAAERGDAPAQRRLGRCYASGIGVPLDPAEAFKWLTLACQAGDSGAQELRDELAGELCARERWEAQRRAREWTLRKSGS